MVTANNFNKIMPSTICHIASFLPPKEASNLRPVSREMRAITNSVEFIVSQVFRNNKSTDKLTLQESITLGEIGLKEPQKELLSRDVSCLIRREIKSLQSAWKGWKYTAIKIINWLISLLPNWCPKPKPLAYFPGLEKLGKNLLNQVNVLTLISLTDSMASNPTLIEELFLRLPNINSLQLTYSEQITDSNIRTIAKYTHNISSLNLGLCDRLTNVAIQAIAPSCANLTTLDLCACIHLTDDAITALLPSCGKLTTLNLSGCNKLTAPIIQNIIEQKCSQLTTLDLHSINITDHFIDSITTNCKKIESLNLSNCKDLTDAAIITLVQNCPQLTSLNLSDCKKLTDNSILAIAENCRQLTSLKLSGCEKLTSASILAILADCHNLTSLSLSHCPLIIPATIQRIHNDHPHVRIINA